MSTVTAIGRNTVEAVHSLTQDTSEHEQNAPPVRIPVLLPDMFVSFMAREPRVNPHYEKVREESEAWINSKCNFDERMRKRIGKTGFSFFCAVSAPDAGAEELRTMCDWGNWAFPWDDMFDEGELSQCPEKARQMMEILLSIMRNEKSLLSETPLLEVYDIIWRRIATVCGSTVFQCIQRQFRKAMMSYCKGALEHVDRESRAEIPSLAQQLATHRESAAVTPMFALLAYAYQIDLPDEVFEHPSIKQIERIGIDLVAVQNDILSYVKEEAEGVNQNLVAICRINGMPAQQAFDRVNQMLQDCYREWHLALADLPQWGEKIDAQVQKYIQGVQDTALANLNWSFKTERYLGKMNDEIRQTRLITVLPRSEDQYAMRRQDRVRSLLMPRARYFSACCVVLMLLAFAGFLNYSGMTLIEWKNRWSSIVAWP